MTLLDWLDEQKYIASIASSKPLDETLKTSLQKYVDRNFGKKYITQEEQEKKASELRVIRQEPDNPKSETKSNQKLEQSRGNIKSNPNALNEATPKSSENKGEDKETADKGIRYSFSPGDGVRYSLSTDEDREGLSKHADKFYSSYTNSKQAGKLPIDVDAIGAIAKRGLRSDYRPAKSLQDYLIEYIIRSGMTNVEVYKKARLSKSVFSSIFASSNHIPKKNTVIALAIALKLNLKETETLLMKAGYTFSNSIVSDLVVVYFINRKKYDIDEINRALYELKQPLLGSKSY